MTAAAVVLKGSVAHHFCFLVLHCHIFPPLIVGSNVANVGHLSQPVFLPVFACPSCPSQSGSWVIVGPKFNVAKHCAFESASFLHAPVFACQLGLPTCPSWAECQ
jgi:hypothetical protein